MGGYRLGGIISAALFANRDLRVLLYCNLYSRWECIRVNPNIVNVKIHFRPLRFNSSIKCASQLAAVLFFGALPQTSLRERCKGPRHRLDIGAFHHLSPFIGRNT